MHVCVLLLAPAVTVTVTITEGTCVELTDWTNATISHFSAQEHKAPPACGKQLEKDTSRLLNATLCIHYTLYHACALLLVKEAVNTTGDCHSIAPSP